MDRKIDISSTILEKGFDAAKEFLGKLMMPAIEETGLLLKDQVSFWKFKNQIRMLNKAKIFCERNNISPKAIPLKLLSPLLDYSGLEEDEILQDKWAILLSNMVDSEQNIENHVFPYILSQLSSNEFLILERVFDDKQIRITKINNQLADFRSERPEIEQNLNKEIQEIDRQISEIKEQSKTKLFNDNWDLRNQKRKLESELFGLRQKESAFLHSLKKPEPIPFGSIKDFELSNIIRLGLAKEVKEFSANSQTIEIPYDKDYYGSYISVDFDIDMRHHSNWVGINN